MSALPDNQIQTSLKKSYGGATPESYGGIAFTDATTAIQEAVTGGYDIVIPRGKTYNISSSIIIPENGTLRINGGGALNAVGMAATSPMFRNTTNKSAKAFVDDIIIVGQCTFLSLILTGTQNAGLSLKSRDVTMIGSARAAGSRFLDARQVDFLHIENTSVNALDQFVRIRSDFGLGERDNTQIHFSNINVGNTNVGAQFSGVDKADISGFDVAHCAAGFIMEFANKRIHFNACHVEDFGAVGYAGTVIDGYTSAMDGYGWYFKDSDQYDDMGLDFSSAFPLTSTGAKAGVYVGTAGTTESRVLARGSFAKETASSSPGYKAVINKGVLRWDGGWSYTAGQFTNTGSVYVNGTLI